MSYFHFTGAPCLQHSNYVFYKSFRYKVEEESRVLSLGDFFFLKILQDIPFCIGEIELLWEDKASNQLLSSLRLYFQPEHTQDGRQEDTGEDEVLVLGERLVLRLDDLLPLMLEDLNWTYGHRGCGAKSANRIKEENGHAKVKDGAEVKAEKQESDEEAQSHTGAANVAIMSYPRYCRYRAVMRRLEGCENEWLHLAVVMAIGGFSGRSPGCQVMFCRDAFFHPEIDDLEIRMDHMWPVLKKSTKGKKIKQLGRKDSLHDSDSMEELFANITPSISTSSRPRRSTEPSDLNDDKVSAEEQAFLIGLHKFMQDAKMPIERIPYLGFKQIDLYMFYKHAEKLGGYDCITTKRMWKQLYDRMGGNLSNTSAATCTRKHYERLLLPYERHLRKFKPGKVKKKKSLSSSHQREHFAKKEDKHRTLINETVTDEERERRKSEEGDDVVLVKKEELRAEEEVVPRLEIQTVTDEKSERRMSEEGDDVVLVKKEELRAEEEVVPRQEIQNAEMKKENSGESHSMADWKNGSEPLEIPNIRHRQSSTSSSSRDHHNSQQAAAADRHKVVPEIQPLPPPFAALGITEQQFAAAAAAGLPGAVLPADFGAAEGTLIPNTNLVYRGGYLVPIQHQPQMLSNPWGMMAAAAQQQPPPHHVNNSHHKLDQASLLAEELAAKEAAVLRQQVAHHQNPDSSNAVRPTPAHNANQNHNLAAATISSMDAVMLQNTPGLIPGGKLRMAHSNTPYQPSPYHLTDHIQQATFSSSSTSLSRYPNQRNYRLSNNYSNSSQHIISLLHPRPPNLRNSLLILPPAPAHLFLHPSNSNVLSPPLPQSNGIPPSAHSQSRKRLYPFENPPPLGNTFPSPDMVLDRIKSSTVLPNSATPSRPSGQQRQQYDSPRDIFKQTAQTFASSGQNSSGLSSSQQHARKTSHHSPLDKRLSSKSLKTPMRKNSQVPQVLPYGATMPSLDIQVPANGAPGFSKGGDQMRMASGSGSNGFMPQEQAGLGKAGAIPHFPTSAEGPIVSSKDGRLTSALFGAQFTAMPRPAKQNESPSVPLNSAESPSSSASAAAAAMSLSPLLHPAFMNTFLPPGVPPSALNPQMQMFAGAYGASAAQIAAYEELMRQNGFGPFLSSGTLPTPAKMSKKN